MWRGCVEPSGLKDWSSAFIFQGHGCNTRPTQVSRKTESTREGKGGGEGKEGKDSHGRTDTEGQFTNSCNKWIVH